MQAAQNPWDETSGSIEIKFDQEGNLPFFSINGQFPSKEIVEEGKYILSLEKIKELTKEQLKLIEFPSFEQERLFPVYAIEEINVTNDKMLTILFEFIVDVKSHLKDKRFK